MLAEIFRELGYEGASLSRITERTGIGKGSLYHFFPGGKEEMALAVLENVDNWFEGNVYETLRHNDPTQAIADMLAKIDDYFHSGNRICLVGAFALDDTRDRFADKIKSYFRRWIDALGEALIRSGRNQSSALADAEEIVLEIQGALVLARALDDRSVFSRVLEHISKRISNHITEEQLIRLRERSAPI